MIDVNVQIDDDTLISRKGIIVNDDNGLPVILNPCGSITRITDDEAWLWNICYDHSKDGSVTFGELVSSFVKISNEDGAVIRKNVKELVMALYKSSTLDIRKN